MGKKNESETVFVRPCWASHPGLSRSLQIRALGEKADTSSCPWPVETTSPSSSGAKGPMLPIDTWTKAICPAKQGTAPTISFWTPCSPTDCEVNCGQTEYHTRCISFEGWPPPWRKTGFSTTKYRRIAVFDMAHVWHPWTCRSAVNLPDINVQPQTDGLSIWKTGLKLKLLLIEKRTDETAALHSSAGPCTAAWHRLSLWGSHTQRHVSIWTPWCSLLEMPSRFPLGKTAEGPASCSDITSPPEVNAEQPLPGQHSTCELCRKTMQEEIRAAMEHLLPPETHHASSSAAWKDLACYDLSEAPWQPMMMEMYATFILLSRQNEEQRCQGASARWKIASFSEKWRLARNFSSNFSHHSYLKSSAMVISPNLPRPSWLFSYNSTPWNPNTKFCLHIPSTSQQHPWKIHLQSQEQKVTTKKPAPFHQEKEKRFTSKPAWGLLFDLRG